MKKQLPANLEKCRVDHQMYVTPEEGSIEGAFIIEYGNKRLRVISGCGDGWDHVSVSLSHRTPTWEEMTFIKNLFFEPDELVIQFHPPAESYVNFSRYVLHLWKPWGVVIELPPRWMIAPHNIKGGYTWT
jgi:hypothetical protein